MLFTEVLISPVLYTLKVHLRQRADYLSDFTPSAPLGPSRRLGVKLCVMGLMGNGANTMAPIQGHIIGIRGKCHCPSALPCSDNYILDFMDDLENIMF